MSGGGGGQSRVGFSAAAKPRSGHRFSPKCVACGAPFLVRRRERQSRAAQAARTGGVGPGR